MNPELLFPRRIHWSVILAASLHVTTVVSAADSPSARLYENRLKRLEHPKPLLGDHPEFVEPVIELTRYEAPTLVDDADADLLVRAWRFSYNVRGIIEMPNRLKAAHTAVIMVHPWGIDDGQGWRTPEPAGVADFCTIEKNILSAKHTRQVIDPFLRSLRGKAAFIMYSLPGDEDPIRKKLYRSIQGRPTEADRREGAVSLKEKLHSFIYAGEAIPSQIKLGAEMPVADYFRQFPGLDSGARYNGDGFWKLPIPVTRALEAHPEDVVIYDAQGYDALKRFLKANGIRHVLLTGYATDMCYCRTTAGYENLSKDFNVFLVGDATLATFPSNSSPRFATNASISHAALDHLITQVSWVRYAPAK
jgi:hypothetical protein